MINRPKFKDHLRAKVAGPDRVLLFSAGGEVVLEGRLNVLLTPLIDGRNRVADIVDRLEGHAGALDVHYGLACLEDQGCIVETEGDDEGPAKAAVLPEALRRGPGNAPEPLALKSQKKVLSFEAGHRGAFPEDTFKRYQHLVNPVSGIIGAVEPCFTEESGLVHLYLATHNFDSPYDPERVRRSVGRMSAGKGMTRTAAKTSALCEALERYSGIFRGDEARRVASYTALGDSAVHPNACMNFSSRQYREREAWNRREADYNWVPQPFNEEREIDWTPVWSLTEQDFKYVPTAYCYYGCPLQAGHDFCRPDSNGSAAGCSLEEAILSGFLELVERDSVALWWYNRVVRPGVNLETFGQPFQALQEDHRARGRQIHVLDITNDLEIPAFAAVSRRLDPGSPDFIFGFGAHLDAAVAISRALSEVHQFLLLAGEARRPYSGTLADPSFLMPDPGRPLREAATFLRPSSDDLLDDVMTCVKCAQKLGMETLVLNQTRSEVGLPVAKVFVPGMRQFWARLGSGRLYDAPVALGWLRVAQEEDELNPAHLMI